jgi:hypothetical protein
MISLLIEHFFPEFSLPFLFSFPSIISFVLPIHGSVVFFQLAVTIMNAVQKFCTFVT